MTLLRIAAALTIMTLTIIPAALTVSPARAASLDCIPDPGPKYQPIKGLDGSNYPICYTAPTDDYKAAYTALQSRHILEAYSQFLSPLLLPHPLTLLATTCTELEPKDPNRISPYYAPGARALVFCYEWYNFVLRFSPTSATPEGVTRANAIAGMWAGTLLHETGHAIFDMLDVPVFGREEDAADQMAAFIALQFNTDVQRTIIKGFAYFWQALAKSGGGDPPPTSNPNPPKNSTAEQRCQADPLCAYSDEHGTASQRLYNTLCFGYGANRAAFQDLVDKKWLPKTRADDCKREYDQLEFAFGKTVYPFIDSEARKKVQSIQWLAPDELK